MPRFQLLFIVIERRSRIISNYASLYYYSLVIIPLVLSLNVNRPPLSVVTTPLSCRGAGGKSVLSPSHNLARQHALEEFHGVLLLFYW